jgi:N-acetylneuraminic acid mutarotase
MHFAALLRRFLWVLGLLVVGSCLDARSTTPWMGAPASMLRERFPEQAGLVLEKGQGFVADETGFVQGAGSTVTLPREGDGPLRFRGGAGTNEVRVREVGAEGAGVIAEQAVAYLRAGGTSFWTAVGGGVEEWLHLDAGVARDGEVAAAWEVESARVRQHGDAVEVVDEAGWVRLRVTAPVAYAAGGREVKARLAARGARIELSVEAGGEAVLVDPVWSLAASMSTARSWHTATLLGSGKVLVTGGEGSSGILASAELYDPVANIWTAAASLITARLWHTATLLGNGKVLVTGGEGNSGILTSAELYDPVANTWTAAGSMSTARYYHTATLLGNGTVLVAGGELSTFAVATASAELYDPVANTWSAAGSLSTARDVHTATLLGNGTVLVAGGGGTGSGTFLASAELYDPVANVWTAAGSLSTARVWHTATLLGNGKVLVAGGEGSAGVLASAELYDPVANAWTEAGSLISAREYHTGTLLGNGKVLVAGGVGSVGSLASAELYDPVANTWTAAGSMSIARYWHTATLLGNGQVLVAGGLASGSVYLASAELYDTVADAGAWSVTGALITARYSHTATRLGDGKVLVAGGGSLAVPLASAELYDPVVNTWTAAASLSTARTQHTATLLGNGKVLVAGGEGNGGVYVASAELYDPVANTWTVAASLTTARGGHTATLLGNGKVLVAGGEGNGGVYVASAELYDPVANTWTVAASLTTARDGHTATLLGNGTVLVAGGVGVSPAAYTHLTSAELYDPVLNTWTAAASLTTAQAFHTATLLGNGMVLVAGGQGIGGYLTSAELYDPVANAWTAAGALSTARVGHTATLLGNGTVLVVGGSGNAVYLASAELYDPVANAWTAAGSLSTARVGQTATLLGNGTVLVAGGQDISGSPLASAELFVPVGSPCALGSDCPTGFCANGVCCDTACSAGACAACSVAAGAATDGICALFTGTACNDGNACTQTDTCQTGVCTGSNPVTCTAEDQCHTAGACDTTTGACSNPAAFDGTPCGSGGSACTQADTCQSGVCTPGSPVVCLPQDPCHTAGTCNPATGTCSNPAAPDSTPCDDNDPCTQTDTCQAGVCKGANPVVCSAPDACHDAYCDPTSGQCASQPKADGAPCDDGSACTQPDTCQNGFCVSGGICTALDACHLAGTCDPVTGCNNPAAPDGTPCDDGNACTGHDGCQSGVCTGVPTSCPWTDACHPGVCDPTTGLCSNPYSAACGDAGAAAAVPAGVTACNADADCPGGFCVDKVCCDSQCEGKCFSCALPGHVGQCTAEPTGVDLRGDCGAGAGCLSTCGPGGTCVGAGKDTQCEPSRCTDASHGLGPALCPSLGAPCPIGASVPFDCGRYRCEAAFGACYARCTSVADCAPGSVCDPSGSCVAPPDVAAQQNAGCSMAAPGARESGPWWLLLAAVAGAALRPRSRRRARVFAGGALVLGLLVLGCGSEPTSPDASGLRLRFPEQAAEILEQRDAFAASAEGFGVVQRGGLTARLPGRGESAIGFDAAPGFEARVREIGASGEGALAGGAVVYARAGGRSYWAATGEGYEEWLLIEAGEATAERAAAVWEVEGATLFQHGDVVELRDEGGRGRLRVRAPRAYAAGGRQVEARLEVRGATVELWVDAGGEAVLVDPAWTGTVGAMNVARSLQTATLLGNGQVLVAGGYNDVTSSLASAELYDPVAQTWTLTPSAMSTARSGHTATLLGNGQVLVAGGDTMGTAELYDPVAQTWTLTPSAMSTPRSGHTATLLGNGQVLVTGGASATTPLASADLYDPVAQTWTLTPSAMSTPRTAHTATLLGNGQVLVAGGADMDAKIATLASAELYDPVAQTWTLTLGTMSTARYGHTATLLGSSQVLVAGGNDGTGASLTSAELFDPASATWTTSAPMNTGRWGPTAALLGSGEVLVAGGYNAGVGSSLASAELYDPVGVVWTISTPMNSARWHHAATLLPNGQVLVEGGFDGTITSATAELFDPVRLSIGAPCTQAGACASGFCTGGVCCTSACNAGPCQACTKAAGAPSDGTCAPIADGTSCDDDNPCTQTDACVAGVCKGENPVVCSAPDACTDGYCNPGTGQCATEARADGAACSGYACATPGVCQGGVCNGATPIACDPPDACHDAVCDPAMGTCSTPAKVDGAACDDGNACTQGDACQAGVCQGTSAPDGTPCDDGNACTSPDTCTAGVCQGTAPAACTSLDACHDPGTCDPDTGLCSNPVKPSCDPSLDGGSDGGAAIAASGLQTCAADADCPTGHCADGVCCDTACTERCSSCVLPGHVGQCTSEPTGVDLRHDCGAEGSCVETCGPGGACVGAGTGTECVANHCTDASHGVGPAYCQSEGTACPASAAVPFDCGSYLCEPAVGACYASCRSVAECAPGWVCGPSSQCVQPPDVAAGYDVSCGVAAAGSEGDTPGWAAGLLVAAALRLRRRASRPASRTGDAAPR